MGKWQVIDILNEGHPVVFINFHTESNASIRLQNSKTQMVAIFFPPKYHLCVCVCFFFIKAWMPFQEVRVSSVIEILPKVCVW